MGSAAMMRTTGTTHRIPVTMLGVVAAFLVGSCARTIPPPADDQTGGGADPRGGDGAKPASVARPSPLYAADSPFNRRIEANPEIDPDSSTLIAGMVRQFAIQGFSIGVRESAIAVYEVGATTTRHDVRLAAAWAPATVLADVPIPDYAEPDPNNDREIVFFDPATRCEFDFWQFRRVDDEWVASWGNSISLDSSGFFARSPGGARAGGSGLLGGLIWPEELSTGRIDHALIFSYGETKTGGPVAPATQTDGWSDAATAIPEGALLQLDPAFDVESLEFGFERTIARALQEYGMYLLDTTSAGVQLYAVNPLSVSTDPYADVFPEQRWEEDQWVELTIPVERFRVLKMGPQDPSPPQGLASADGCGSHTGGNWREGVWKVVARDNLAYLAAGVDGLEIVDVSDPSNPVLVGAVGAGDLEPVVCVQVAGTIAYAGTDGSGLQIVDVSDASRPRIVGSFGEEDELGFTGLAVTGHTVYAAEETALYILDVSSPAAPAEMGRFDDAERLANARDVFVAGDVAYLSDQWYALVILDASDPAAPQFVSTLGDDVGGDSFGMDVFVVGSLAYYGDEDVGLSVVDIADPASQALRSTFGLSDAAYGVYASGDHIYIANGAAGLQILDASAPSSLTRAGQTAVPQGYARDVFVSGTTAYLAAQDGGLVVVDVADPARPAVLFSGRPR